MDIAMRTARAWPECAHTKGSGGQSENSGWRSRSSPRPAPVLRLLREGGRASVDGRVRFPTSNSSQ